MSLEVKRGLMLCSSKLLKHYKNGSMARFSVQDYSSYTKQVESQKKGKNLENVFSQCHEEVDWDRPKVHEAIEIATEIGLIIKFGKEKERSLFVY